MMSPRPSLALIMQHYSRKGQYDSWLNELPDRTPLWDRRLAILRRFATGGTLLDVGAGIGEFIARASFLFDCVGVEPSAEAVELAQTCFGVAFRHGLLEDLPHRPGSFDVVTLWHVLEHVPLPGSTLARCCQLLRLGGHLAIAVPNASRLHWRGLWQEGVKNPIRWLAPTLGGAQRSYYQPYPAIKLVLGEEIHLSHFTQRTLLGHLRTLGCTVRYTGPDLCVTRGSKLFKVRFEVARFLTAVMGYNPFETMFIIARRDAHLQKQ
jgi:2-polyprenyl-3-methyl-5-hydroxy-6-metoxy-1,4-benzoquinol methylase